MNKFVFALLVVAVAVAQAVDLEDEEMSQFAIQTTDSEEKIHLKDDMAVFGDYCISSRDYIFSNLKQKSRDVSSNLFTLLFNSAEALGKEALNVQQDASNKLAAQLANPDADVSPASEGVDKIVADGQTAIKGQSAPVALITAFKTVLSATSQTVGKIASDRLNALAKLASMETLGLKLGEACERVAGFESELREQFDQFKQESLNGEEKYASLTLDDIPCVTAWRVIKIEGLCQFAKALRPSVGKLFGKKL